MRIGKNLLAFFVLLTMVNFVISLGIILYLQGADIKAAFQLERPAYAIETAEAAVRSEYEYTTYYPVPYGRYTELISGKIGIGTTSTSTTSPLSITGLPDETALASLASGDVYYDNTSKVLMIKP